MIALLSDGNKRVIPFVERIANNTLEYKNNIKEIKSYDVFVNHSIYTMVGLYLQFLLRIVLCIVSEGSYISK